MPRLRSRPWGLRPVTSAEITPVIVPVRYVVDISPRWRTVAAWMPMAMPALASSISSPVPDGCPPDSSQPTQNTTSTQNSRPSATVSHDGQISRCAITACERRPRQPASQRPVRRADRGAPTATPAT